MPFVALCCSRLAARRLLALLVAVLCIAGWLGVESTVRRADEVSALAGPGVVGRTSPEVDVKPDGPAAPDGVVEWTHACDPGPCVGLHGLQPSSAGAAIVRSRKGQPGAPRGPPLLVVS